MNAAVKFTCTSLDRSLKKGILKPDANGYYEQPIGALNVFNSAGQWYDYNGAKSLFESSSQLMRRLKRGALRSEIGHPVPQPGQSEDDYLMRILTIDERNVCAHIAEITLDFNNYKGDDGKPIIAIIGKVTPSGPHAAMLQRMYDNPKENVCFSIRAFTADHYERTKYVRILKNVITFDYVNEPGISVAEKFKSTALEHNVDRIVTKDKLLRAMSNPNVGIAKESLLMTPDELFASLGWSLDDKSKPKYLGW